MSRPADTERRSSLWASRDESLAESEGDRRSATFASFGARESTRSGAVLAGRYQVRGFLTRGATARVYLAEDLATRAPVVVKMLSPENAASVEFRGRLVRGGGGRQIDRPSQRRHRDRRRTDRRGRTISSHGRLARRIPWSKTVDPRSDVYSLGVVMFRAFTGHLPFESVGQADLVRHQLFSSVPPPSWLNDALDPLVDHVVQTATRKHRENRYPTMAALIADLDVLLGLDPRELTPRPLVVTPDAYLPSSERGREAFQLLAEKFGEHARGQPSGSAV